MRYAFRRLLHQPGFSLVVVLTLALGHRRQHGDLLAGQRACCCGRCRTTTPSGSSRSITSIRDLEQPRSRLRRAVVPRHPRAHEMFERFAVMTGLERQPDWQRRAGEGHRRGRDGGVLQGVRRAAAAGRTFATGEDKRGRRQVVVLGHGFWQRRFGGDPNVVGRKILLGGEPFDVIGVMPVAFYRFFNRRDRALGAGGVQARPVRRRQPDERVSRRRRPAEARASRSSRRAATSPRLPTALKHDHPASYDTAGRSRRGAR